MHDSIFLDITVFVQVEDDAEGQLLLVRAKTTYKVAKMLWEHRNGAVDKIDTCGTLLSLTVDDVAFFHIMTDVSNVNTYLIESII